MVTFGALLRQAEPYQPKRIYVSDFASKDEIYAAREADVKKWIVQNMADITTPEFKRWFGNSQVVGADGRPLILFHGTRPWGRSNWSETPFSEFKMVSPDGDYFYHFGSLAQATDRVDLTLIDTPPTSDYEKRLSEVRLYAVFLSIQNPLQVSDIGVFKRMGFVKELRRLKVVGDDAIGLFQLLHESKLNRIQKLDTEYPPLSEATFEEQKRKEADYKQIRLDYDLMMRDLIQGWLEDAGYDGLKYKNEYETTGYFGQKDEWSYAALRSNQVKAVNNGGRWDARSKDVFNGL